ncbi:MAG TPA: FAD binding domain-containing protein [Desulfomonilaceae bacterium]|nr:FAD binding domain-containing protein [Desulfomonilaceae bacterium]
MSDVHLPRHLKDVWPLLLNDPRAAVYAGGTDLLAKVRSADARPRSLVCLERVEELKGVRDDGEEVYIGAGTALEHVLHNPIIEKQFPVLVQAIRVLASPAVRHMGTIGGNIVTASPAGDTLPPLHVLDADVVVRSAKETRRASLASFIRGPGKVDLGSGEILAAVVVKKTAGFNIHHYEKVGKRKAQACAVASMAAIVDVSEDRVIRRARFAWGSVGPTVIVVPEVERAVLGRTLSMETLREAACIAESAVSPIDDLRASASYRRRLAGALLLRLCALQANNPSQEH